MIFCFTFPPYLLSLNDSKCGKLKIGSEQIIKTTKRTGKISSLWWPWRDTQDLENFTTFPQVAKFDVKFHVTKFAVNIFPVS